MLVTSGLPPAAALRAATLTNATVLGEQDRLGPIAPKKWADLIVLSASSLDDIRNTRQTDFVVRSGIICRPAELLQRVPKE